MRTTKAITVVHPESQVRIALRTLLEAHGCVVSTDYSCRDLLSGKSDVRPDLILVDRTLLEREGMDVLSQLTGRWKETEIIFLPEEMNGPAEAQIFGAQLLRIVDRMLGLRTNREILAV